MIRTRLPLAYCCVALSFFLLSYNPLHAQEPSADAVTETLKERVQKVLETQGAAIKGVTTQQRTTFGIIGTLDKVVGSSIQIRTLAGELRIIELDPTTLITRQNRTLTRQDIELNIPVVVTGTINLDRAYTATTLELTDESIIPRDRSTLIGVFGQVTSRSLLFTSLGQNRGTSVQSPLRTSTQFLSALGTPIDRKTLKSGERIVVVTTDTTATASAQRVYALPQQ